MRGHEGGGGLAGVALAATVVLLRVGLTSGEL